VEGSGNRVSVFYTVQPVQQLLIINSYNGLVNPRIRIVTFGDNYIGCLVLANASYLIE